VDKGVKHVLFYVGLKPGNLILAELEDRSLAILRDDVLIPDHRFAPNEMVLAVQTYQRLKSELIKHPHAADPDAGEHRLH
jgi:hypothetical protein